MTFEVVVKKIWSSQSKCSCEFLGALKGQCDLPMNKLPVSLFVQFHLFLPPSPWKAQCGLFWDWENHPKDQTDLRFNERTFLPQHIFAENKTNYFIWSAKCIYGNDNSLLHGSTGFSSGTRLCNYATTLGFEQCKVVAEITSLGVRDGTI